MKSANPHPTSPNQARYAQLGAILRLHVAELERALDRDEADRQNWEVPEVLVEVDRILAEALDLLAKSRHRAPSERRN